MAAQPERKTGASFLKDYVFVHERIADFYADYPDGRIITTPLEVDPQKKYAFFKAEIYRAPDDAEPAATGHSYDLGVDDFAERAETGAVGRALTMLNYAAKRTNGHSATQGESRITPKQLEDIRAMAKTCIENGDTKEALRDYLLKTFGVDEAEKLTEAQGVVFARNLSARIQALKQQK